MRTVIAASLLAVAVAKDAAPKKGPLITTGVVGTFMQESVLLTRDLTYFTLASGASLAWAQVPEEHQKKIPSFSETLQAAWNVVPKEHQKVLEDSYTDALDKADTLRLQNGLPKPTELFQQGSDQFHGKFIPAVQKAYDLVTKAAEKPFGFVKTFISKFEAAYPEHAGLLSAISIWDFLLTIFFVVYFVLGYSKRAFCYVFCCGMCRRRASVSAKGQPQLVKKNAPPLKANGISKKR